MALPWLLPKPAAFSVRWSSPIILFIGVLGLDVLMGYAGQVSLGQGGFMAIGGYTAAILAVRYGWPPLARHRRRHRRSRWLRFCAVA